MSKSKHAGWRSLLLATAIAGFGTVASAAPVNYEGSLIAGTPVTGQVGGTGWLDETASEVDFWRFSVAADGTVFTIRGARVDQSLDPVMSFYRGTTTADEADFRAEADWGGLVFLGVADDEVPDPLGPGGDPLYSTGPLAAGDYTIAIGGFLSDGAGPFAYSLLAAVAAVPEPGTLGLSALGLAALLAARHRRRRAPEPA